MEQARARVPSRAVVLGGGGPVGRGWQAGLLAGLVGRGVEVGGADLVVGTSAGAITGALLAAGADLTPVAEPALRMGRVLAGLVPSQDASVRAGFGRRAVTAQTMSESESSSRAALAPVAGLDWPLSFAATVVHARTGRFRVLRAGDGVPLRAALAASSALPGVYPPITIEGEAYVDGGLRSMLNADLAAGCDTVAVISCFPSAAGDEADVAALRDGGASVVAVSPEERLLGRDMLDQRLVSWAYQVGLDQAPAEADRLTDGWTG